jgi:hypothetical protein
MQYPCVLVVLVCVCVQAAAKRLVREALGRGSADNVTCVVVDLQNPQTKVASVGTSSSLLCARFPHPLAMVPIIAVVVPAPRDHRRCDAVVVVQSRAAYLIRWLRK